MERDIVRQITHYVQERGGVVFKIHQSALGKGSPDLYGGVFGQPFAVEVKQFGGVVSNLQLYRLNQLKGHGYVTGVVYSLDEFKELFNVNDAL